MEKNILNKLTKDEVLRRLQESKRRKQDRLKELEEGLKAWPAGPVLANKLSPRWGCSCVFDAIES